jgi:hypothetical protein
LVLAKRHLSEGPYRLDALLERFGLENDNAHSVFLIYFYGLKFSCVSVFRMIKILGSAYRHGLGDDDILRAWNYHIQEFFEGEDPEKIVRLGFDTHGRLLEIGGEIYPGGGEKIFHAMPARLKYTRRMKP